MELLARPQPALAPADSKCTRPVADRTETASPIARPLTAVPASRAGLHLLLTYVQSCGTVDVLSRRNLADPSRHLPLSLAPSIAATLETLLPLFLQPLSLFQ